MSSYVWLESEIVPESSASFFLPRSGLECGAGVFTTLLLVDGQLEQLSLHIERLKRHAKHLGVEPAPIFEEYFYKLVEANKAFHGAFRVKAQYVAALEGHTWGKTTLLIYLEPWLPLASEGLHVGIVSFEPSDLIARVKTLSRLERRILYTQAKTQGFDEYLTVSKEGYLLEGIYANLFWEYEGVVYTPDPALPLMYGITIQTLFEKLPHFGYRVCYVRLAFEAIPQNAHPFLCNSLIHYLPILTAEKRKFKRNIVFEATLSLLTLRTD